MEVAGCRAPVRARRPGRGFPHYRVTLSYLDVQGLHLTLEAIHHDASPARFFFPGGEDSYFPARSLLGAGKEAHSTFPARGEAGLGMEGGRQQRGQKGAKLLPFLPPLRPPERGFRPRTPVAARKLCPFKGTVASRRGGGKEGRGLQTRRGRLGEVANAEKPPPLPAATATFPHPRVPNRRPSPKETF